MQTKKVRAQVLSAMVAGLLAGCVDNGKGNVRAEVAGWDQGTLPA